MLDLIHCFLEGKPNRSSDVGCVPNNIVKAVQFLSLDELQEVKRSCFGVFLNLTLKHPCHLLMARHMMSISELKEDHIAIKVQPVVILKVSPNVIETLLKVPHGTSKLFTTQEKKI
jgi:hypothetical protein